MASVEASSMVSVVLRWIGTMMHLGSFSSERMIRLQVMHLSHFGWRSLRSSTVGGGCTLWFSSSASSSSGAVSGSGTSNTENQLLSESGGVIWTSAGLARAIRWGVQNLLMGCPSSTSLLSNT